MLGQTKLAAGTAEAIDYFDGHNVSRPNGLFPLGDVAIDDLIQSEELPE